MTDKDECFTLVTLVGVSNNLSAQFLSRVSILLLTRDIDIAIPSVCP